jgi:hypothetical protein
VVGVQFIDGSPLFPKFKKSPSDPFLKQIQASGKKWVILSNTEGNPKLVLDADGFLRAALFQGSRVDPFKYCHKPIVITDITLPLGEVIRRLKVESEKPGDDVIDKDIILVWWGDTKQIITGADILGRLMHGIVAQTPSPIKEAPPEKSRKKRKHAFLRSRRLRNNKGK